MEIGCIRVNKHQPLRKDQLGFIKVNLSLNFLKSQTAYSDFWSISNQALGFINEWKSVGFVDFRCLPACASKSKRKFGFGIDLVNKI